MKICTISDTHSQHELIRISNDADMIIHAGDISNRGVKHEVEEFMSWYGDLPHKHKILIAGNHDFFFEKSWEICKQMAKEKGIHLLYDTSVTIEGLVIWGSPVQPKFFDWAFNRSITIEESMTERSQKYGHSFIGNHWDKIPENVDILVTHGPPKNMLDLTQRSKENVGCPVLARHIKRVKPIMHVFGHIHEERGVHITYGDSPTTYVNASSLNLNYNPYTEEAFVFDLEELKKGNSHGRD